MYHEAITDPILSYFAWVTLPVCLVLFAAGLTHLLAPQAAGDYLLEHYQYSFGKFMNKSNSQDLVYPK